MLNKKNAAYAVIGFALVGCNNVLAGCDCCKGVPKELERFTFILKNLKGVTYKTLSDFFNKDNVKGEEFLGKDLINKNLADQGHSLSNQILYIVNCDENKNEMKVYKESEETTMRSDCKGKKYKTVKITFEAGAGNTETTITNDEKKYKITNIEVESGEKDVA